MAGLVDAIGMDDAHSQIVDTPTVRNRCKLLQNLPPVIRPTTHEDIAEAALHLPRRRDQRDSSKFAIYPGNAPANRMRSVSC